MTPESSPRELCVVLFRGRTGSSLLMQTLRILGKPVLGNFAVKSDLELNPRGYFELAELRDCGLTPKLREEYLDELDKAAVKILVRSTFADGAEQWAWFARTQPQIFITYRHPLEQILSGHAAFGRGPAGEREMFMRITRGLRAWTADIGRVVLLVRNRYPTLIPRIAFIGYHEHLDAPAAFVERVARHAGLKPDETAYRRALNNIDGSLYRFRFEEFPKEYRRWYSAMPARRFFERLRKDPVAPWELEWPAPLD